MPFQDDIGLWENLGELRPVPNQWLKFQRVATEGNAAFRLKFSGDFGKSNYLWLRARYETAQTVQTGRIYRIYPTEEPQLIEYPHPKDFELRNVFFRSFEVQKKVRARLHRTTNIGNYTIRMEELT